MTYTNEDIARCDLSRTQVSLPTYVNGVLDDGNLPDEFTVADAIAGCCAVGYGGHYWEPLDDEEHVLHLVAREIAPMYEMDVENMTLALIGLRGNYSSWLESYRPMALQAWRACSYNPPTRLGPDNCPTCNRRIKDDDELGCEAPDGQRWCIEHALEELARLRGMPDG